MDIIERINLWKCQDSKTKCKGNVAYEYCECKDIEAVTAEVMRLRKANKRLGEIATDAVEWLPPASVNGPREEYQNEIKELTDGYY